MQSCKMQALSVPTRSYPDGSARRGHEGIGADEEGSKEGESEHHFAVCSGCLGDCNEVGIDVGDSLMVCARKDL